MGSTVSIIIDDRDVEVEAGQSILAAAESAGVYIPRLCHKPGIEPHGSCRVCTVKANGRTVASCTTPVTPGAVIEVDTDELNQLRRELVEMLFVEGNHFCMFCEKSGNCELQAMAYRLGITAPTHPYLWQKRDVDASHPHILIDHNRCIMCARCMRTSQQVDGKDVFHFVGRGPHKRLGVNSEAGLAATEVDAADKAVDACPVGALLRKRTGYQMPVGRRRYDAEPIGSEIEAGHKAAE